MAMVMNIKGLVLTVAAMLVCRYVCTYISRYTCREAFCLLRKSPVNSRHMVNQEPET